MADNWYAQRGDKQVGPMPLDRLKGSFAAGRLRGEDLVWKDGWPEWRPAGGVAELSGATVLLDAEEADAGEYGLSEAEPAAAAPVPAVAPRLNYSSRVGDGDVVLTPLGLAALRSTRPWVLMFAVLAFIFIGISLLGVISMLLFAGAAAFSIRGGGGVAAGVVVVLFTLLALAVLSLYFFPALFLLKYASAIGRLNQSHAQDDLEAALVSQKSFWKFLGVFTIVVIGLYVLLIIATVVLGAVGASRGTTVTIPTSSPPPPRVFVTPR